MGKGIYARCKRCNCKLWKVNSLEEAKKIIRSSTIPLVVKADGLASGKGVFIPESRNV